MKVLHISTSYFGGGAARAAYRIHKAFSRSEITSWFLSQEENTEIHTNPLIIKSRSKLAARIRPHIGYAIMNLQKTHNKNLHSPSVLPSGFIGHINASDADIINLHWVQGEFISVEDIGRIRKPIVWTLHDMWAFCGAEHYTSDQRYIHGYKKFNRSSLEEGLDINRWVWRRKLASWKNPISIICPSNWLFKAASSSYIMSKWPIYQIGYPLDSMIFRPLQKKIARDLLQLPQDTKIIVFGAIGLREDYRKGFDIFIDTLIKFHDSNDFSESIEMAYFGSENNEINLAVPYPTHNLGFISSDIVLRAIYCAADVVLVPSREDNLPQVALEAQMCGTPVVAFNIGGLSDIVNHLHTGYLAKPFSPEDLARGIAWVINNSNYETIRCNARKHALKEFSPDTVCGKYIQVYKETINGFSC